MTMHSSGVSTPGRKKKKKKKRILRRRVSGSIVSESKGAPSSIGGINEIDNSSFERGSQN